MSQQKRLKGKRENNNRSPKRTQKVHNIPSKGKRKKDPSQTVDNPPKRTQKVHNLPSKGKKRKKDPSQTVDNPPKRIKLSRGHKKKSGVEPTPAQKLSGEDKSEVEPIRPHIEPTQIKKNEVDHENQIKKAKIKYYRGPSVKPTIFHKSKRSQIAYQEHLAQTAVEEAARSEILLTEEPGYIQPGQGEHTWEYKQHDIKQVVDLNSANKIFDLTLNEFGPYTIKYSSNGRYILLAGRKGHVALFDWFNSKLMCELYLNETVHDIVFLHNETMFAVAQKERLFIYDKNGVELHSLKNHWLPRKLEFLPYHFLLVSGGKLGWLNYQDTSTGDMVAKLQTKMGSIVAMAQNPYNAIIHTGHERGRVSLWAPNMNEPLVTILAHNTGLTDIVIDQSGNYMVTSAADAKLKVWDIRKFTEFRTYNLHKNISCLSMSQRGLLATAFGSTIQVWKNYINTQAKEPYLIHQIPYLVPAPEFARSKRATVHKLGFCPFEDVLGIGHQGGFSSIIIPGSGEPNIDTYENNPYQTKSQRREMTVVRLLDKIPYDMICLNPNKEIGKIVDDPQEIANEKERKAFEEKFPGKNMVPKYKAFGRSSAGAVQSRKQMSILERQREEFNAERIQRDLEDQEKRRKAKELPPEPVDALKRFAKI